MSTFLLAEDVVQLTGRKLKSKQIEALRRMGLPFFINARGAPVVPSSAVDGKKTPEAPKKTWSPPPA